MNNKIDLAIIPNVGKQTAIDLKRVGIQSVDDLKNADAVQLFEQLCALDSKRHDPCTLDIFFSAVDYATNGTSKPWWQYTDLRKTLYK